jgi:hypothetical protein
MGAESFGLYPLKGLAFLVTHPELWHLVFCPV